MRDFFNVQMIESLNKELKELDLKIIEINKKQSNTSLLNIYMEQINIKKKQITEKLNIILRNID